jgi:hypothetical protein
MKTSTFILILVIASSAIVRADGGTSYTRKSRVVLETFTSKVIKVLSFEDGDSEYDAYVVNWKDHEVVVASNSIGPGNPKYKVGDVVTCNLQQNYNIAGGATKARVSFSLGVSTSTLYGSSEEEQRRLQAIAEEVRVRRAAREISGSAAVPAAP